MYRNRLNSELLSGPSLIIGHHAHDYIPAIIAGRGERPITRTLDIDEYKHELRRKLHEEVEEFCATGRTEELVDILEVVYALASVENIGESQLEEMRWQRLAERGGFDQRIYLIETLATGAVS